MKLLKHYDTEICLQKKKKSILNYRPKIFKHITGNTTLFFLPNVRQYQHAHPQKLPFRHSVTERGYLVLNSFCRFWCIKWKLCRLWRCPSCYAWIIKLFLTFFKPQVLCVETVGILCAQIFQQLLTLKTLRKILEQMTIYFYFLFFKGNNAWHYMWIICQADDSHVMSSIISPEK